MTRDEANKLLDEVKIGKPYPDKLIDLALLTTGDLHGKLYNFDTYLHHRFGVGYSPDSLDAVHQN